MIVEGTLPSTEPAALALRMANHFGHKVPVETRDGITHVQTAFGSFALEPQENQLDIRLAADTEPGCRRLQEVVSSHLARFAREPGAQVVWR
jgi:hypothetical protein